MRGVFLLFLALMGVAVAGPGQAYRTEDGSPLPGSLGTPWSVSGTITNLFDGSLSTSKIVGNGSAVYTGSIVGSTSVQEVYADFLLQRAMTSGERIVLLLRATTNAAFGTAGEYYALEVTDLQVTGWGKFTADFTIWKRTGGVNYQLAFSDNVPFGSTVTGANLFRFVLNGSELMGRGPEGYMFVGAVDSALTSGQPGFALNVSGSGGCVCLDQLQLIEGDTTAPPVPVDAAITQFPTKIDISWKAPADTETQITHFDIYKWDGTNWVYFRHVQKPAVVDDTVVANKDYRYRVYSNNMHIYNSNPLEIDVRTPPTGYIEPNERGLKPHTAHWERGRSRSIRSQGICIIRFR